MMNEAIKLAIEKDGYNPFPYIQQKIIKVEQDPVLSRSNITYKDGHWEWAHQNDIVLDPLFWQSLGKALGWGIKGERISKNLYWWEDEWKDQAHRWLSAHFEGKEDKFWQELLNTHSNEPTQTQPSA